MAFIRSYRSRAAEQGDPFALRNITLRAGQLVRPLPVPFTSKRGRPAQLVPFTRARAIPPEFFQARPFGIRAQLAAGDPFLGKFIKRAFKPPKFIRKLQPGKVLANVAKAVVPIAASLVPGIGGVAATLLANRVASGAPPPVQAEPLPLPVAAEVAAPEPTIEGFTDAQLAQLVQLLMFLRGGVA